MACEEGQRLHAEFQKAVEDRLHKEIDGTANPRHTPERSKEIAALAKRSFHIRDCIECWTDPPKIVVK